MRGMSIRIEGDEPQDPHEKALVLEGVLRQLAVDPAEAIMLCLLMAVRLARASRKTRAEQMDGLVSVLRSQAAEAADEFWPEDFPPPPADDPAPEPAPVRPAGYKSPWGEVR